MDAAPVAHAAADARQVATLLQLIEGSRVFRQARRHRLLLRHLVERAEAGDQAALKETVIAVEVFGRPASQFDPRADSIVRVETRRLRARLARFFDTEGQASSWRIELPVGSYVPQLVQHGADRHHRLTRQARDMTERGEHFLRLPLSLASLEAAQARFDEALRDSPGHAPALVGLARSWLNLATGWWRDPREAWDHAAEALRQALALAPDDAMAHALWGAGLHQFDRDWPAARRSFKRALALAPQQAFVHMAYGAHLVMRGDAALAEQHLQHARELDAQYLTARLHMVNLRVLQGRLAQAQAELSAAQDLAPGAMQVVGLHGLLALLRGETATAVGHYQRCCELVPEHPACQVSLAAALGADGQQAAADALLTRVLQACGDRVVSPYVLAIANLRCGRPDTAVQDLFQALAQRDPNAVQLPVDPSFKPLHQHASWPDLVTRARHPAG